MTKQLKITRISNPKLLSKLRNEWKELDRRYTAVYKIEYRNSVSYLTPLYNLTELMNFLEMKDEEIDLIYNKGKSLTEDE